MTSSKYNKLGTILAQSAHSDGAAQGSDSPDSGSARQLLRD